MYYAIYTAIKPEDRRIIPFSDLQEAREWVLKRAEAPLNELWDLIDSDGLKVKGE